MNSESKFCYYLKFLVYWNFLYYNSYISLGCFGYCCAPCMICANAKALGKMPDDKPPLYCVLACCIPVLGIFLLRQTARENYGIEVIKFKNDDIAILILKVFSQLFFSNYWYWSWKFYFREIWSMISFAHAVFLCASIVKQQQKSKREAEDLWQNNIFD